MVSQQFRQFVEETLVQASALTPLQRPSDEEFTAVRQKEQEDRASLHASVPLLQLGGLECVDVTAEGVSGDKVILYFHGGGYIYLTAQSCYPALLSLSKVCNARCIAPNYRRAPESPYPAALEDAVASYRALLDTGLRSDQVVFSGDSAGGGLALLTALAAIEQGLPAPAAIAAFSPWTDLTISGASADAVDDPVVDGAGLRWMAECYLAGADPRDPLASPLYTAPEQLAALPPTLIQVGSREALLDDARRFAVKAQQVNSKVEIIEHQDFVHMWMIYMPDFPETILSFQRVRDFINRC